MPDQPVTPTPKKAGRRHRRQEGGPSYQRRLQQDGPQSGDDVADFQRSSGDEDALFGLLGISSPPPIASGASERGILPVSKGDIEQSKGKQAAATRPPPENMVHKRLPRQRRDDIADRDPVNSQAGSPQLSLGQLKPPSLEERATLSEGEGSRGKARRKGKGRPQLSGTDLPSSQSKRLHPNDQPAAESASRPIFARSSPAEVDMDDAYVGTRGAFNMTSLSKSLPSSGFLATRPPRLGANGTQGMKGAPNERSEDESNVWEMPDHVGGQELTWQQKLQSSTSTSESTPKRSTRSTPSDKDRRAKTRSITSSALALTQPSNPSPLHPRPGRKRRVSFDTVPAASTSTPITKSFSAFDSTIPYHTGYNVGRPPQTPAKTGTSRATGTNTSTLLPIVGTGEFPRLAAGTKGPLAAFSAPEGSKYAGPSFHNSPHAANLPKPDTDDF